MQFEASTEYSPEIAALFGDLKLPRTENIFIAEGEKVVVRLLESDIEVISLYLTEEHFTEKKKYIESHKQESHAKIFIAPKKAMERIVGFTLHQGILAAGKIPAELSLRKVIAESPHPKLFIILDAIADAENVGTLYRSALALGASAVILDEQSVSPWIRRAVRVSMGAVFKMPTITMDLEKAIEELHGHGVRTFAATISEGSVGLWESELGNDIALVFGSEGYGIRSKILDKCSAKLMIPMKAGVDSLNVGVAQGIVLYEVMRQRARSS